MVWTQIGFTPWLLGPELRSEHPLGRAVVRGYRADRTKAVLEPTAFAMLPGQGVVAQVDGRRIAAGNPALLTAQGVPDAAALTALAAPDCAAGCTVIYLAVDGRAAGTIALADTLREDAARMIAGVQAAGVTPVLLTGDHEAAARRIAQQIASARCTQAAARRISWNTSTRPSGPAIRSV